MGCPARPRARLRPRWRMASACWPRSRSLVRTWRRRKSAAASSMSSMPNAAVARDRHVATAQIKPSRRPPSCAGAVVACDAEESKGRSDRSGRWHSSSCRLSGGWGHRSSSRRSSSRRRPCCRLSSSRRRSCCRRSSSRRRPGPTSALSSKARARQRPDTLAGRLLWAPPAASGVCSAEAPIWSRKLGVRGSACDSAEQLLLEVLAGDGAC